MSKSIEWANSPAAGAPAISGDLPGPKSRAIFERAHYQDYGSYYSMITKLPVAFDHGEGVTLVDADGNRFIDLTHGHMVAGLGHGHPAIVEAISRQAGRLMNVREFPTEERVQLEERLRAITPGDLNYFQFFNTGTEMTEAALRLARAATGGHEFVSFYGDYHGRTTSAAATSYGNRAGGPRPSGFVTMPSGFCYRCEFDKTFPECELYCLDFVERAMTTNSHGALAGIIAEPITNGSGARVYPDGYLRKLREIADRHNILLIFDEHATGLGRTGKWFAADHEDVVPDALLMAKWLGNGFPITVLAVREKWKAALPESQPGTTFGGQPIGCAAALAVLDVIEGEGLVDHAHILGETCLSRMREIEARHRSVGEARGRGLLLAFDFVQDKASRSPSADIAMSVYFNSLKRGVLTSLGGMHRNAVRVSPMLVASEETALRAIDIVEDAITEAESAAGY